MPAKYISLVHLNPAGLLLSGNEDLRTVSILAVDHIISMHTVSCERAVRLLIEAPSDQVQSLISELDEATFTCVRLVDNSCYYCSHGSENIAAAIIEGSGLVEV
jgi:hypothetical protein